MKSTNLTILAICVAAGLWWGTERSAAAELRHQLDELQLRAAELARLREEHIRLKHLEPSTAELDRLRRETVGHESSAPSADEISGNTAPASGPALQPGRWAAAAEWKNCGRSQPEAALETMLWASAGGDIVALKKTLEYDDASRAKAAALFINLPEASRRPYATPEDLLAVVVAGNIPLESAQFVASQPIGDDEVTEFVRIKSAIGVTRQVHLTVRRTPDGWKLRVPAATLDGIFSGISKLPAP